MTNWYIAKIAPRPFKSANDCCEDVERKILDEGFDCYYPRLRREIVSHRTHKIVTRTFPLFMNYIFIQLPTANPEWVKDCDGISYVLGCDGRGVTADVERFRAAEENMEFDDTRESRIKRGLEAHTARQTVGLMFPPKTRITTLETASMPGYHGFVTSPAGRDKVRAMLETIQGLMQVTIRIDQIRYEAAA